MRGDSRSCRYPWEGPSEAGSHAHVMTVSRETQWLIPTHSAHTTFDKHVGLGCRLIVL